MSPNCIHFNQAYLTILIDWLKQGNASFISVDSVSVS